MLFWGLNLICHKCQQIRVESYGTHSLDDASRKKPGRWLGRVMCRVASQEKAASCDTVTGPNIIV